MTTSNGKTQEGYNEIGEVTEFHMEKYSVVKANVPDLFIKFRDWYPVLVEVSGMCQKKKIFGIDKFKRGFLTTFLVLKLCAIIPRSNQSSSFPIVKLLRGIYADTLSDKSLFLERVQK